MKVFTIFAVILLASSVPAGAQPVKDVIDAQEAVRQQIRDMQPAVQQIREMTQLLQAFARVQRELSDGSQPGIAIDKARSVLEDYDSESSRRGSLLDRDTRAIVDRVRRDLDAAHNGAMVANIADLRERIHHNAIHPLQRRAIQMAARVDAIIGSYESAAAMFRVVQSEMTMSQAGLAMDPEKP